MSEENSLNLNNNEENVELQAVAGEEWILRRFVDVMREEVEDDLQNGITYGDELRALYKSLFKTHYELLKMCNPQWSVGKRRLIEWRKDVDRLEEIADGYAYITEITSESVEFAKKVLPQKLVYRIGDERIKALASIRSVDDKMYVAGCIVYHPEETADGKVNIYVDWLYVEERFRNDDVANSLMAQMFLRLSGTKIDAVFFDYDVNEVETEPVVNLLRNWHFALSVIPDYYHTVSLLECQDALEKKEEESSVEVKPLPEIDRDVLFEYLRKAVLEPGSNYDKYLPSLPFESFEENLSCYTEENGSITGLLLVDKDSFGRLELLMLRSDSELIKVSLLKRALDRAIDEYTEYFVVRIPMRDEKEAKNLSNYFEQISPYALMRAIFMEDDKDVDEQTWEEEIAVSRFSDKENDKIFDSLMEE
ncbi:MAG: hypothetical protein K6E91_08765 [Butyrivibrio sp.]|nr:hypothetical protein [Butyrivibrio sp.]